MTLPGPDDYIPGYLTKLTINGQDYDGFAASGTLTMAKGVMTKAAFGVRATSKLGGQITTRLEAAGHASPLIAEALWTAFVSSDAIAATFETHPGVSAKNVSYALAGCVVADYVPASSNADGEVEWSLTLEVSDLPTPTWPTP